MFVSKRQHPVTGSTELLTKLDCDEFIAQPVNFLKREPQVQAPPQNICVVSLSGFRTWNMEPSPPSLAV